MSGGEKRTQKKTGIVLFFFSLMCLQNHEVFTKITASVFFFFEQIYLKGDFNVLLVWTILNHVYSCMSCFVF